MMTPTSQNGSTAAASVSQSLSPPDPQLEGLLDAEFFRALGDGNRLRILACLAAHGGSAAVQVVAGCVAVDYSVVARHLKVLAAAGVLEVARCGRTTCYALRRDALVQRFAALAHALTPSSPPTDACCVEGACELPSRPLS